MRHLPLAMHYAMTGKRDRAGRLLTDGDRMAAYPDAQYWRDRYEAAGYAIIDAIGQAAFDAWVDGESDSQSWMAFALHAECKLAEVRRQQPATAPATVGR
jgi:hypothetical protein